MGDSAFLKLLKDSVTPVLLTLVTIFTSINGCRITALKTAQDLELQSRNQDRVERNDRAQLDLSLFEAVRSSLASGRVGEQQAARALVVALADDAVRDPLLAALGAQGDTAVRRKISLDNAAATSFDAQVESVTTAHVTGLPLVQPASTNYDVFWRESSGPAAQQLATRLLARMRQSGLSGRLRARMLPDLVNARAGYRIYGYEIRYDPGEQKAAVALKAMLDPLLGGAEFRLHPVSYGTRHYLSVFVSP